MLIFTLLTYLFLFIHILLTHMLSFTLRSINTFEGIILTISPLF